MLVISCKDIQSVDNFDVYLLVKLHRHFCECRHKVLDLFTEGLTVTMKNGAVDAIKWFLCWEGHVEYWEECNETGVHIVTASTWFTHGSNPAHVLEVLPVEVLTAVIAATTLKQQLKQGNGLLCAIFINLEKILCYFSLSKLIYCCLLFGFSTISKQIWYTIIFINHGILVLHIWYISSDHGTCGMFMSSMKTMSRLPGGGPYVSLVRFSTLASKFLCTSRDVVRLEKLMLKSSCKKDEDIKVCIQIRYLSFHIQISYLSFQVITCL